MPQPAKGSAYFDKGKLRAKVWVAGKRPSFALPVVQALLLVLLHAIADFFEHLRLLFPVAAKLHRSWGGTRPPT